MKRTDALTRLLKPRHIAVFGGQEAAEVIRQCERIGFRGPIWPVHPERDEIAGRRCFRRVTELPEAPDASFIAVPREASIALAAELTRFGAGGAVCYASGFSEVGGIGIELQERLVQAAADMAIVGPNCYGLLNYLDGAALWPDQHGGQSIERGVAIVTQSGNIGISLTMQRRAVPLAYLITVGNQASLNMHHYVEALIADPRVSAIGLHMESLGNIEAFSRVASQALAQGVPLVALKAGRSELGAKTALSHTRSLSGADALYQALFARFGIAQVHTLAQFLETLKLLAVHGPLPEPSIASISCSGGEAALVADLAHSLDLTLPSLTETQIETLRAVLGERVTPANPLDYHTYIWGQSETQSACFAAMLQGKQTLTLKVLDFPREDRCDPATWTITLDAFSNAVRQTKRHGAVVSTLPEGLPEPVCERLLATGIAPMQGLEECLIAARAAAIIGAGQRMNKAAPVRVLPAATGTPYVLNEWDSKQILQRHGIPVPTGHRVSAADAPQAAADLGFPVVVKALGPAHKSEAGAVRLNLQTADQVRTAVAAMAHLSESFIVETMAQNAVAELIVGANRDPQFGLTLTLGAGGVLVELLSDTATLLLPTDKDAIHRALKSLKIYTLLQGYRGRPAGDVEATVAAIRAVARYLETQGETLLELDINPLLVMPRGVLAADALICCISVNQET